jgi:hypothetical protein
MKYLDFDLASHFTLSDITLERKKRLVYDQNVACVLFFIYKKKKLQL